MGSRDSGPVAKLERQCVYPGYWLIEGHDVTRVTPEETGLTSWVVSFCGKTLSWEPSFRAACDFIRNL
jgi:hypothetical protein